VAILFKLMQVAKIARWWNCSDDWSMIGDSCASLILLADEIVWYIWNGSAWSNNGDDDADDDLWFMFIVILITYRRNW